MWNAAFEKMVHGIIRTGDLDLTLPSGARIRAGDGTAPHIKAKVTDMEVLRKIAINPEMGVGEGYMDQKLIIEDDDLRGFLTLAIKNTWSGGRIWWHDARQKVRKAIRFAQQRNLAPKSRQNVAHHYDLSGELYDLFLDSDKQYSCAYFRSPDDTLEQAQAQKKAHIAGKLLLEPGMRVLDIGCGWGGMALTLARDHGANVLGVTLSEEQIKVARARAEAEGLSDRVRFELWDYRSVTEKFDRIVSVGMFEHVGVPFYDAYFAKVAELLDPDGVSLIHTIGRSGPPGTTSQWIDKYIFPGGYVPALSEMSTAFERARLTATDLEVWRNHYAETLVHWQDRFTANWDRAAALYDERFCRMWKFYLTASELTFRYGMQVVFQAQLAHRKTAVPLTRDYLYRDDVQGQMSHAAE